MTATVQDRWVAPSAQGLAAVPDHSHQPRDPTRELFGNPPKSIGQAPLGRLDAQAGQSLRFADAAELHVAQTRHHKNGAYQGTEYAYTRLNADRKPLFAFKGWHHGGEFSFKYKDARWYSREGKYKFPYASIANAKVFLLACDKLLGCQFS